MKSHPLRTVLVFRTGRPGTWRDKFLGVSAFAKAENWRVMPVDARDRHPNVGELVRLWHPDGIIVDASGNLRGLDWRRVGKTPVVFMTPSSKIPPSSSTISTDAEATARLAIGELMVRELAALAFCDLEKPVAWSVARRSAFASFAASYGMNVLSVTPEKLASLPKPCGIFAATDARAAEVLLAAEKAGIRVPEELSVVGVDDDPEVCEICVPTLTSVRPDFHALGFSAAMLLSSHMAQGRFAARNQKVAPLTVVRRGSTRLLHQDDPVVNRALDLIRTRACEGLSIDEIAALFGGCSRRRVEQRFKESTGQSMTTAILGVRLQRACEYLRAGKLSVSAISDFCGWSSDLAFRKAFKARFGVAPLRWVSRR